MNLIKEIWEKIKEIGNRRITVFQSAPPYLLIGLLFLIQQNANSASEQARDKDAQITNFKDCVDTGRARVKNKVIQYGIFDVVRELGAQEAGDKLQEKFDKNYSTFVIQEPDDCLNLPEFKGKFTVADFPPER